MIVSIRSRRVGLALLLPMIVHAQSHANPVVMIAIDGLRPSELTSDATRAWNVPVLRGLSRDGAAAVGVRGVVPTLTLPNMVTLVTGTWPSDHGIVNNIRCGDDTSADGGYYWYRREVKVPMLWDAARQSGLRTANVGWTSTVGAAIDSNLPYVPPGTPQMSSDQRAARARTLIGSYGPSLLTIFFEDFDNAEHRTGLDTPEDREALEHIDRLIGQVVTTARARWPDVTIVIVSDHGFVSSFNFIDLARAFADAGLAGKARPCPAGGSAYIQIIDSTDAGVRSRVAALLQRLQADTAYGIDRVLDRDAIRARGGWGGAESMIVFKHGYVASTKHYRGMHGYWPDDPAMYATLIMAGPHVPLKGSLGIVDMRDIAPTVAKILGVRLPTATGRPLF